MKKSIPPVKIAPKALTTKIASVEDRDAVALTIELRNVWVEKMWVSPEGQRAAALNARIGELAASMAEKYGFVSIDHLEPDGTIVGVSKE